MIVANRTMPGVAGGGLWHMPAAVRQHSRLQSLQTRTFQSALNMLGKLD